MLNVEQMRIDTEKAEQLIRAQRQKQAEAEARLKTLELGQLKASVEDAIKKNINMGKWFLLFDVRCEFCYDLMAAYPELHPSEVSKSGDSVRIKFTWERT